VDGLAWRPDEFVINGHSWMVLPWDLTGLVWPNLLEGPEVRCNQKSWGPLPPSSNKTGLFGVKAGQILLQTRISLTIHKKIIVDNLSYCSCKCYAYLAYRGLLKSNINVPTRILIKRNKRNKNKKSKRKGKRKK
jgi:hypothetical protein